ncbi:MAG TPA: hypothetical protein VED67_06205 [Thermodesulfovibrionales bacterium]|nr:hypothetical protein [Thermodesulfovibrionales bacterium]
MKTGYAHIIGIADFEEQVRNLMRHQHREMIRELITGKCETVQTAGGPDAAALPQGGGDKEAAVPGNKESVAEGHTRSLDEILLEHISRKVKK